MDRSLVHLLIRSLIYLCRSLIHLFRTGHLITHLLVRQKYICVDSIRFLPTMHRVYLFRQCKFSVLISILGLLRIINAIFIFQCISAERYITRCACAGRRKNNCNFHLSSFCVINGRGNFENGKKRFSSIIEDIFMRLFFV